LSFFKNPVITSNKKNLIQNNESFSILLSGTYLKKNIEYNISFDPKKKTFKNFFFQYIIKMFFQYHYSKKIARVRSAARMEKIFSGRMAIGLLEKIEKSPTRCPEKTFYNSIFERNEGRIFLRNYLRKNLKSKWTRDNTDSGHTGFHEKLYSFVLRKTDDRTLGTREPLMIQISKKIS
jgi:hypothetical protein